MLMLRIIWHCSTQKTFVLGDLIIPLFTSDEFDALYEAAMKEVSSQKQIGFYRKMNDIIMQEAAVVPLYYDQVVRFVQNNIDGLPSNAMKFIRT